MIPPEEKILLEEPFSGTARMFIVCGFFILCLFGTLGLLSLRTLDSHECFVSVTAREMVKNHDWLFPTCNGQPRLNKTPLSYWLVAAFSLVTGKIDAFTARFPSAVFGFLSVSCIYLYIKQWFYPRVALISGAVWLTTLGLFRYSHSARPEMALTFFVLVCYLSFYDAIISPTRKRQIISMLIFWVSLGLGMLAKGPAPIAYVFVPLFVYIFLFRKWKTIPKLLPLVGPVLFLLIVLPWPLYIGSKIHWNLTLWRQEYVERLTGDYVPGHLPFYCYLLMMFKFITPWAAFLPMALICPFYSVWKEKQPLMKYLWICFVAVFVFLTLDQGKRQHYILPIMPTTAILIGILLEEMIFQKEAFSRLFSANVLRYHAIILAGGSIIAYGVVAIISPPLGLRVLTLSLFMIFLVAVTVQLFRKQKPGYATCLIFTGIIFWCLLAKAFLEPQLDTDKYARNVAVEVARRVPPSETVVAFQSASSRFVQYYGKTIPIVSDETALKEIYEKGGWIFCNLEKLEAIKKYGPFDVVYSETEIADTRVKKRDYGGALFHKASPATKRN